MSARLTVIGLTAIIAVLTWTTVFGRRDRGSASVSPLRVEGARQTSFDRAVSLDHLVSQIGLCRRRAVADDRTPRDAVSEACTMAVYVWSPRMPLSSLGIPNVAEATRQLGLSLMTVDAGEFYVHSAPPPSPTEDSTAPVTLDDITRNLIAAGATTHYPALLIHRDGHVLGSAILGYKTAEAYRAVIEARLAGYGARDVAVEAESADRPDLEKEPQTRLRSAHSEATEAWWRDYPVDGSPGAYFRAIPGRSAIAFEAQRIVYIMGLEDGIPRPGPGTLDFVPTPDGRLFVTPAGDRRGLQFYNSAEVMEAARRGEGQDVSPLFVDRAMQDQYPSVGVLSGGDIGVGAAIVYRVLTSWFDRAIVRDYRVIMDPLSSGLTVHPTGEAVPVCKGYHISIPIIGPDGRELVARDEMTGSTKIFQLDKDGTCTVVLDLGIQTGKAAWDRDGRRIAFAVQRGAGRGAYGVSSKDGIAPELYGIFVLDRARARLTRVPGSRDANRLTFPEFVGRDSIAFLITGQTSRFRLVCCVS